MLPLRSVTTRNFNHDRRVTAAVQAAWNVSSRETIPPRSSDLERRKCENPEGISLARLVHVDFHADFSCILCSSDYVRIRTRPWEYIEFYENRSVALCGYFRYRWPVLIMRSVLTTRSLVKIKARSEGKVSTFSTSAIRFYLNGMTSLQVTRRIRECFSSN